MNKTTTTKPQEHIDAILKGYQWERDILKRVYTSDTGKQEEEKQQRDFATLLRNYENATRQGDNEKQLIALATSCAYSVLKKCIDVSQNPQLKSVKRSITQDNANIRGLDNASKTYHLAYNEDGDIIQEITDKALAQAHDKLSRESWGDGLDLVNTAILSILEETSKTDLQGEFMEVPYTIKRLKKKVYIKVEDSAKGWEEIEVTPIQQVYRSVRQEIERSRAMSTDAQNGYTYLEEYATDEAGEEETRIYRRLPKYADLGGQAIDFNGKATLYSADSKTVQDIDALIEKLNLSVTQAKVLELRMRGYGNEAIATYLGVKKGTINEQNKRIAKKAIEVLDLPKCFLEKLEKTENHSTTKINESNKKQILNMYENGFTMSYIALHFNVSKMTISRIIKQYNS